MQVLEAEHVQRVQESRPVPDFRAGDILEVQVVRHREQSGAS